jgi:predicted permease
MTVAFLRLLGFTLLGYLLFIPETMRRRFLPFLTAVVVNFMFPLYSVTRYGMTWDSAVEAGGQWMIWFFVIGAVTLYLQYWLARGVLRIRRAFPTLEDENRVEFLLLFAIHNAGYIPLPILQAIAPPEVTVYMFSYVLAFQLIFWSFVVSVIDSDRSEGTGARFTFKLNMPLVGLLLGLLLAATGIYQKIPALIRRPAEAFSAYAMDGILVVLGGILAGVPRHRLLAHREFGPFIVIRQFVFPALVLGIFVVLRLLFDGGGLVPGAPPAIGDTWRWLQLVIVLEAAVPPATNLAIATKAFGSEEQLNYAGTGLILTYLASAVGLPLFVVLAITI